MKFSLVNGQRQEAQPNLSGECPVCGQATVAKCGEVKIWHWAHKGRRTCDPWWENETEWHRTWKGQFPEAWQEVVHPANSGEKHIGDVTTDQGWVIEFQHSYLKPDERRSRDDFYPKLVWVVNGARRKRDAEQFRKALNQSGSIGGILGYGGYHFRMNVQSYEIGWVALRRCLSISEPGQPYGGFLKERPMGRRMSPRTLAASSSKYIVAVRRRRRVSSKSSSTAFAIHPHLLLS